ncbi:MAG: hypothetical protein GEU86_12305 [Actinophytocola sp.]|nr:hypothetical protein [Actinophytocola sp.]
MGQGHKIDWEEINRINHELDGLAIDFSLMADRAAEEHIKAENFGRVDGRSSSAGTAAVGAMEQVATGVVTATKYLEDFVQATASAVSQYLSDDEIAKGEVERKQKELD